LRNLVPAIALFRACGSDIPIIIYDFYYENTTLRMTIIQPTLKRAFDAFAFQEDIIHLLIASKRGAQDNTRWMIPPGYQFFFIQDPTTAQFVPMSELLTASVKNHKFNASLQNWLTSNQFLRTAGKKTTIPDQWRPLPMNMARYLYASPLLARLNLDGTCSTQDCLCGHGWMTVLKSGCGQELQEFVSEFAQHSLQFYQTEFVQEVSTRTQTKKQNVTGRASKSARVKSIHTGSLLTGVQFKCALDRGCPNLATHAWGQCCGHIPRTCQSHADAYDKPTCPIHGVVASITQVTVGVEDGVTKTEEKSPRVKREREVNTS